MGIYFLRHLKTVNNKNNIITGCEDIDILPDQIVTFDSYVQYFDYIFCSPLLRCRKTVEFLPKDVIGKIYYLNSLVERNVGVLEGVNKEVALLQYPELFIDNKLDIYKEIPDGESILDVQERLTNEILPYIQNYKNKNILICSHNQTLKVLYSMIRSIDINNTFWNKINFENGVVVNIE